ncbi:MAG: hypothetical protein KC615_00425 [Anaerolineae bacterium]|nr:hypothetical protein [Anaerolineae bacterium]
MDPVPTGHTSAITQEYFQHLYQQYFAQATQTYYIHWDILVGVFFWIAMLALLLFWYSRWQRTTQTSEEPYPLESYNGFIQEGNGRVGPFLTAFFVIMFTWLAIVTIMSLTQGQIY